MISIQNVVLPRSLWHGDYYLIINFTYIHTLTSLSSLVFPSKILSISVVCSMIYPTLWLVNDFSAKFLVYSNSVSFVQSCLKDSFPRIFPEYFHIFLMLSFWKRILVTYLNLPNICHTFFIQLVMGLHPCWLTSHCAFNSNLLKIFYKKYLVHTLHLWS